MKNERLPPAALKQESHEKWAAFWKVAMLANTAVSGMHFAEGDWLWAAVSIVCAVICGVAEANQRGKAVRLGFEVHDWLHE